MSAYFAYLAYRASLDALAETKKTTTEAHNQGVAAQGQLAEIRAEQRAWIGRTAGMADKLEEGHGVKSSIVISNFGKSPAKYFYLLNFDTFTRKQWSDNSASGTLSEYGKSCMISEVRDGENDILFPAGGNNSKTLRIHTADPRNTKFFIVDRGLIKGDTVFTVRGCVTDRRYRCGTHLFLLRL